MSCRLAPFAMSSLNNSKRLHDSPLSEIFNELLQASYHEKMPKSSVDLSRIATRSKYKLKKHGTCKKSDKRINIPMVVSQS